MDLQADCLAGVWANRENGTLKSEGKPAFVEPADIDAALTAASGGDITVQRQRWFNNGFGSGSVESCNTFSATQLLTPATTPAADATGAHIDQGQEVQQDPQRIPDPVEFFDKRTGKPKVWYWRADSGYEFYDAPGFHPRTGDVLTGITREVIADWLRSQKNATRCYIIQRDSRAPVIYRDHLPGMDPETGRECRLVTISLVDRLNEYANGKKPGKIIKTPPEFFDPRTSEPIVWYADHAGAIQIFDLLGYDPETSEELLPVTPEIVDRWKAQQAKPPHRVDLETHPLFDPKTGRPNIWHSPGENGALEFFDGPGFHPRTGKTLTEITRDFADKRLHDIQTRREDEARAKRERDEDEARAREKRTEDEALERRERLRQEQANQFVVSCDELAANPGDRNRRTTKGGVSYDQLKTQVAEAIKACTLAVENFPNDLASHYQLARAVELIDPAKGQAMQDKLVKRGYPAAFDNAGSLLLREKNCRRHCVDEAVKLFKKGAALGDPDSMMSLAEQIGNGQAKGDMISLYQSAAKLGHPGAKRALEALAEERTPPRVIFRFPF